MAFRAEDPGHVPERLRLELIDRRLCRIAIVVELQIDILPVPQQQVQQTVGSVRGRDGTPQITDQVAWNLRGFA